MAGRVVNLNFGCADVCLKVFLSAFTSRARRLGADHLTSEGGGGGGGGEGVILKKNILQVHMHKKKILAQDHRAKKNLCTYSGLEKKFWQDVL